jgi:hypothetical protein
MRGDGPGTERKPVCSLIRPMKRDLIPRDLRSGYQGLAASDVFISWVTVCIAKLKPGSGRNGTPHRHGGAVVKWRHSDAVHRTRPPRAPDVLAEQKPTTLTKETVTIREIVEFQGKLSKACSRRLSEGHLTFTQDGAGSNPVGSTMRLIIPKTDRQVRTWGI